MDQATLVGPDVGAAVDALAMFDAAHIQTAVALLAMFPEYGDWRFVLSSPDFDKLRLRQAYDLISETMQGKFVYTLPSTMILPMKDPFIRELRKLFEKTKNVSGVRLGGQTIGNRFLEAGYIFRIR